MPIIAGVTTIKALISFPDSTLRKMHCSLAVVDWKDMPTMKEQIPRYNDETPFDHHDCQPFFHCLF